MSLSAKEFAEMVGRDLVLRHKYSADRAIAAVKTYQEAVLSGYEAYEKARRADKTYGPQDVVAELARRLAAKVEFERLDDAAIQMHNVVPELVQYGLEESQAKELFYRQRDAALKLATKGASAADISNMILVIEGLK